MSDTSNAVSSSGATTVGLLGVLFVGLKLTGYIGWSWWWVTLPFWGGLAVALVIILFLVVGVFLSLQFKRHTGKK